MWLVFWLFVYSASREYCEDKVSQFLFINIDRDNFS